MPSLELAAGQVLTAAHTNTYWMRQVVATGLSSARPTGYEGRAVYDTDVDALNIYTTPTTGWRPPWNLPWGRVGSASNSSYSTPGSASLVDIPSLSFTVAEVQGRRYRASLQADVNSTVTDDIVAVWINRAGSGIARGMVVCPAAAFTVNGVAVVEWVAVATASVAWKAQFQRVAGSGTPSAFATGGVPSTLIVEDMGPATAPA